MYVNKQVMIKNTTKQQKCFKTSCSSNHVEKDPTHRNQILVVVVVVVVVAAAGAVLSNSFCLTGLLF